MAQNNLNTSVQYLVSALLRNHLMYDTYQSLVVYPDQSFFSSLNFRVVHPVTGAVVELALYEQRDYIMLIGQTAQRNGILYYIDRHYPLADYHHTDLMDRINALAMPYNYPAAQN